MKLIVGLGNPGLTYRGTRHNVGFMVLEQIAAERGIKLNQKAFRGLRGDGQIGAESVILFLPLTYMNLSGDAVRETMKFYKIPREDLLVICDDLNLPLGKLRMRRSGSDGGQKGLGSIIRNLGGEEFARLRIGIDSPPPGQPAERYVLGKFPKNDRPIIEAAVMRAAEAAITWVYYGPDEAMNRFNG